jgi:hypothetical protein
MNFESIHFQSTGRRTTTVSKPDVLDKPVQLSVRKCRCRPRRSSLQPTPLRKVSRSSRFPDHRWDIGDLKTRQRTFVSVTARWRCGYKRAVPTEHRHRHRPKKKIVELNVDDLYDLPAWPDDVCGSAGGRRSRPAPDPASYKDFLLAAILPKTPHAYTGMA